MCHCLQRYCVLFPLRGINYHTQILKPNPRQGVTFYSSLSVLLFLLFLSSLSLSPPFSAPPLKSTQHCMHIKCWLCLTTAQGQAYKPCKRLVGELVVTWVFQQKKLTVKYILLPCERCMSWNPFKILLNEIHCSRNYIYSSTCNVCCFH